MRGVASALIASRVIGRRVDDVVLDTFESKFAKPSWCLDVIMMYFIPASFAVLTQASASNCTGLNCLASCAYSATGIRARAHDPLAEAVDALAVPGAGRHRVEPPVDEHPEARVAPPCHACLLLRGGLRTSGASRALRRAAHGEGQTDHETSNQRDDPRGSKLRVIASSLGFGASELLQHLSAYFGAMRFGRSYPASHMAVNPPSTGSATPVMNDASSDTSQSAASAHSSACRAVPSAALPCTTPTPPRVGTRIGELPEHRGLDDAGT